MGGVTSCSPLWAGQVDERVVVLSTEVGRAEGGTGLRDQLCGLCQGICLRDILDGVWSPQ